ncbi:FAD binding domain-containing protein [Treponema phagedenis]|uniref:Carbon monoxide dehydrogenase n=1 Tax=Treponema phagedenis TaxID=162 RepID=A0AAE6IUL3_TREPH|nr:FAD binding domain-containing protein [Treponema phagedenis]QEJ98418.1 carbon monoxide dehydrogenase [Treponema phagedenis]QEK03926.1 carbon monoxide dehydrogenase [Treponema phagedenis]QEK09542.1 carbon monoxide dehydrogenase [Treponema phagedenis]
MFYAAKDKNTLLGLLEKSNDTTFIIAGGTDLVIQLKNSKHTVYDIIDITKINEFAHINETSEYLQIGALVTMRELCESPLVKTDYKALYQAAYELGSTLIRNRATIGGNICNASQSADCSLVLFSYDARIKILNFEGLEKTVPIHEFILGKEKTILSKKEIVTEILIPKKKRVSAFKKIGARKAVTISKRKNTHRYSSKSEYRQL